MKTIICSKCKASFIPSNGLEKTSSICYYCIRNYPRCKAITATGIRCRCSATIGDYCTNHWNKLRKENKLK